MVETSTEGTVMIITTWNVNGIRALFRKEADKWLWEQGANVICLQEVKATQEQLEESGNIIPSDQNVYWNHAERKGYSGVATITDVAPVEVVYGMGEERFDGEGRMIQTHFPDFTLFNIYFPNGQRDQTRLNYKLDFYRHLLDLCDQLHAGGQCIILTGDFNTAHNEIDLANPKENANTSGFMAEERAWIDRYLESGFKDAYRELYPEQVQYTWWTYRFGARRRNIGWRLDYFLVSDDLMPKIRDVVVYDQVEGSDHCPVTLILADEDPD
jgi:exodeoxyribonuclease-3